MFSFLYISILRSHGLLDDSIYVIYRAVVIAKLTYASIVRGGVSRRPTIVNDSKQSSVVESGLDSAILIKLLWPKW